MLNQRILVVGDLCNETAQLPWEQGKWERFEDLYKEPGNGFFTTQIDRLTNSRCYIFLPGPSHVAVALAILLEESFGNGETQQFYRVGLSKVPRGRIPRVALVGWEKESRDWDILVGVLRNAKMFPTQPAEVQIFKGAELKEAIAFASASSKQQK